MDLNKLPTLPALVEAVAASVAVIGARGAQDGRIMTCNALFREMLGLGRRTVKGEMLKQVLPRYARREILAQIGDCIGTVSPVEAVQPFDLAGRTRWWRLFAQPIVDQEGAPEAVLLTCLDITDKVQLESDLKTVNSRFSAVIQSAYDGIVTVDRNQRIQLFNAAAEEMFGYQAEEIVGEPLEILLPERHQGDHRARVESFAGSPIQSRQMFERGSRIAGRAADGSEFPVEVSIAKIQVGEETEFTAVVRDISERAGLIDELRRQATVDLLTGLMNRRAFYDRADDIMALARRNDQPLSVLLLDLDHFKRINDTGGHAAGDMVLRALASAGRSALRETDIFARIGGEEFAILLPATDETAAWTVAEKLRQTIESGEYEHDWENFEPVPFTASIGAAPCFARSDVIDAAMKRADNALYAAKESGRNRVVLWSELPRKNGTPVPTGSGTGEAVRPTAYRT